MLPIIYVDMDGVVADFDTEMHAFRGGTEWCDDAFSRAVMDYKLYTKLKPLSNAHRLMDEVKSFQNVRKEFLTSTGCQNNPVHHREASKQKGDWLQTQNWFFRPNFVSSGKHKGIYFANPFSVLIDDTPHVVENFIRWGGNAILHDNNNIDSTIEQLHVIVNLMKERYMRKL